MDRAGLRWIRDCSVAHKRAVVRRALDDVEPDPESETKAFVADVMSGVLARSEEASVAPLRLRGKADLPPASKPGAEPAGLCP